MPRIETYDGRDRTDDEFEDARGRVNPLLHGWGIGPMRGPRPKDIDFVHALTADQKAALEDCLRPEYRLRPEP